MRIPPLIWSSASLLLAQLHADLDLHCPHFPYNLISLDLDHLFYFLLTDQHAD